MSLPCSDRRLTPLFPPLLFFRSCRGEHGVDAGAWNQSSLPKTRSRAVFSTRGSDAGLIAHGFDDRHFPHGARGSVVRRMDYMLHCLRQIGGVEVRFGPPAAGPPIERRISGICRSATDGCVHKL